MELVSPTIVTAAVACMVMASVYVPARTVTVGIPLAWAAAIAAPMAVYWPLPSVATVTAGRLLVVVDDTDVTDDDDDNDVDDEDEETENVT